METHELKKGVEEKIWNICWTQIADAFKYISLGVVAV